MKHIDKVYPKHPSPCNCMNMRRASRAVTQFYDEVLKPSGLTTAQLALLRHLELAEKATISGLAKTMRIDRTTLNRNMKPLADAGLIAINPGKDSRTREIMLTETGKAAVVSGWALWGEAQESLQEYMGEEDLAKLNQLLAKLEALVP
ncbi:MAG TPA: MarR family winged helix-turn-helix transcriptional regulator [Selenomonadales bacterium]|nr:MarR family winged helix-turn-helix transcriptional regulator [Selenomonadales bacterium]